MKRVEHILAALGGVDNVVSIEPCVTRLRCQVRRCEQVDEQALRRAGAHGVTVQGHAFRLSSARTLTCWLQIWRTYGKKIANPDRILTFGRLMEFSVSCLDHLGDGPVFVRRSSMAEFISNQNKETS